MTLKSYGVLKGSAIDRRLASGSNPHYQIHVVDDTTDFRVAVNVQSEDGSQVEYVVESHFEHPLLEQLAELPRGYNVIESKPNGLALDFIRGNLLSPQDFVALPLTAPGPDNDLNEKLDQYVQRAMGDENALLYAFGERWGPEAKIKDKIFGFLPGNGVHQIHMNQGNEDKQFAKEDGVWQDGGLLFFFPSSAQWVAIFLRFQTQAWHTDDKTGHALQGSNGGPPSDEQNPANDLPTTTRPDGLVAIVGALVNGISTPERESVTLLNTSPQSINLEGWSILDKAEAKMPLTGQLGAGEARAFPIQAPVALSNKGGLITLVNADGLKVDGVSYTRDQAKNPGWTIRF